MQETDGREGRMEWKASKNLIPPLWIAGKQHKHKPPMQPCHPVQWTQTVDGLESGEYYQGVCR